MKNSKQIYDCFPFYNELDLLEIRLKCNWGYVDKFVIVEGDHTFSGIQKSSVYLENIDRFAWASEKIIHVVASLKSSPCDRWENEAIQRDAIIFGLKNANLHDVCLVSGGVDEIPTPELLIDLREILETPILVEQQLYYYYLNGKCSGSAGTFPCPVAGTLEQIGNSVDLFWKERYNYQRYKNGGWHFSFLGGAESIIKKIESYSHSEFDNSHFKNVSKINDNILKGEDVLDRDGVVDITYVPIDQSFPKVILENLDKYKHLINWDLDQKI